MKSTVITPQNAPLIIFRLKQFFQRYESTQSYSDWGWHHKYLNKMGVKSSLGHKFIERSNTSYALRDITKLRIADGYGIIINIGTASGDALEFGQKIKIAPNRITITGYDKILNTNFTTYYYPYNNIKKAKDEISFNEEMDKQYWKDVDLEHEKEIKLQF